MLLKTVEGYLYEEFIYCGCGCKKTKTKYDRRGKIINLITGHHNKIRKPAFHYKGGKILTRGYTYIYKPEHHFAESKGYVLEHRLVYEEYHKCCLLPWAAVHHINENKLDNRIENLDGMMKYLHTKLHQDLKKLRGGALRL